MPTILRVGPYRFFFYSNEGHEPPHIHVEAAEKVAKYWLDPIALAKNKEFRSDELTEILKIIVDNRERLLEAWNGHFGS